MSDSTPPNWPIHNVTLTKDEISGLVKHVYPEALLISVEDLSKGKSFNNRIYFLRIQSNEEERRYEQDIVLKVIGKFFDGRKIQNEVASLLILARFCPDVPVPEVFAWSDDGRQITAIQNGVYAVLSDPVIDPVPPIKEPHPWVMMSKLPGRILKGEDMRGESGEYIAGQLSNMIKSWRADIPSRDEVGNIKLQSAGFTSSNALHGLDTIVSGTLLTDTHSQTPIRTLHEYYNHLLNDQIIKVNTDDIFARLRPLVSGLLKPFQQNTFPHLVCFTRSTLTNHSKQQIGSIFTHQDLSPRNILVSESKAGSEPMTITGLLDLEFAGFFPPEEEYLTSLGRQATDWPAPFMDLLLHKLDEKGVSIPYTHAHGSEEVDEAGAGFIALLKVAEVIESVAPWWLQAGHVKGKELEEELRKAEEVVRKGIEELTATVTRSDNPHGSCSYQPSVLEYN